MKTNSANGAVEGTYGCEVMRGSCGPEDAFSRSLFLAYWPEGGWVMEKYFDGVIIRQKAVDWWPHLGQVAKMVNRAAETRNLEMLHDIFFHAANFLRESRTETTKNELKESLRLKLSSYKSQVQTVANMKRKLKNPVTKRGELKSKTLAQYRTTVKNWPEKREELKREIRELTHEIKTCSNGKVVCRKGIHFVLHYGGKHPARLSVAGNKDKTYRIR